jgi:hypothetical protein
MIKSEKTKGDRKQTNKTNKRKTYGGNSVLGTPVERTASLDSLEGLLVEGTEVGTLDVLETVAGSDEFFVGLVTEGVHADSVRKVLLVVGDNEVEVLLEDSVTVEEVISSILLVVLSHPLGSSLALVLR